MKEVLQEFYRTWLAWVEGGVRKPHPYYQADEGLCLSAYGFALSLARPDVQPWMLEEALRDAFEAQGLDRHYPFGKRSYGLRYRYGTQHRCPKRLAWVRAQLEDAPHETQREQVYA
jgi:hypothetical protein